MLAELKPYRQLKHANSFWFGPVPAHWGILPNRALFAEIKDKNHPTEEMLSVTIAGGVIRQRALLAGSGKKIALTWTDRHIN